MILVLLIAIVAIVEFVDWVVYGWFISEKDCPMLVSCLENNIGASKGMIHFGLLKFASKHTGVTSRWYIQMGSNTKRIPRWSSINKILDEKYAQLSNNKLDNGFLN